MRIVLMVTSSNEHWNGGCEFALVDLTPELTALALRRIAALREAEGGRPGHRRGVLLGLFCRLLLRSLGRVIH
jgi:hypothetical protein